MTHEVFHVAQCPRCELSYLSDPPDSEHLGRYYENQAGSAMHTRPGRLFSWMRRISFGRELPLLLDRVAPTATIVDFGTGDGSVARFLRARGHGVVAVDLYDPAAWTDRDIPYRQWAPGQPIRDEVLALDGTVADAVILRHVLEHLPDPVGTLRGFHDAGVRYVYGVVPNAGSRLARRFGESWYHWDPPRHLTYFTAAAVRKTAESAGFDVQAVELGGIDEVVTSLYRRVRLQGEPGTADSRLVAFLRPTGLAAGLSSAVSAFVGHGVCRFLLARRDAPAGSAVDASGG